jgi:hypothetical protein
VNGKLRTDHPAATGREASVATINLDSPEERGTTITLTTLIT